jgi:hypothetical protein
VATDPVYVRQEISILAAFPNVPRVEVPAATASKGPRLFELRTYESHNERAHRLKVRMFAEMGEVDIFRRVGLTPVFFGSTIAGPRMPNLTYRLVHENLAGRDNSWRAFGGDEAWKKLRATPGTPTRTSPNITTVLLRPAAHRRSRHATCDVCHVLSNFLTARSPCGTTAFLPPHVGGHRRFGEDARPVARLGVPPGGGEKLCSCIASPTTWTSG